MFANMTQKRFSSWLQISRSLSGRRGGSNVNRIELPPFPPETPPMKRCSLNDPDAPCRRRTDIKGPRCETTLDYEPCIPIPLENSIWESGCCEHPCPNMMPRFDQIYYKRSDKANRRYKQTWVECPSPVKKTKIRCCYDDEQLPPIEMRPRENRPQTACNMMKQQKQQDCSLAEHKQPKCMRIVLPGCRSRRTTFHCLVDKNPSPGCPNRECAPYPSFSECIRCRPDPPPKTECGCVWDPLQCEINRNFEKWLWEKLRHNC